jgi:hypothetical protein
LGNWGDVDIATQIIPHDTSE